VHRLTWELYGYTVRIQRYVHRAGCKPRNVELPTWETKCTDICIIKKVHVCARVVVAAITGPKIRLGA